MLTKGPVAFVLLAPPVIAHCWLNRSSSRPQLHHWAAYTGVIAITSLPWFIAAILHMPEFAKYFFWDHNVARFLTGSNHPEPFWFYLPTIVLACMPWGLLLIPLVKFLSSSSPLIRRHRSLELGFLALWSAWCLLFFSASSGKLPTYILPCIPAIMLMIGHSLHATCSPFAKSVIVRAKAHTVFHRGVQSLAAVGILFAGSLFLFGIESRVETMLHGSLWIALLFGAVVMQKRVAPRLVYCVFCTAAFVTMMKVSHDVVPAFADRSSALGESSSSVTELEGWSSELPVACIAGKWGSVPFYLDRDDVVVFANEHDENIRRFIERQESTLLVVDDDLTAARRLALVPHGAEIHELSSTSKAVVLSVRVHQQFAPSVQLSSAKAEDTSSTFVR